MADEDRESRTEEPTPRRLEEARRDGQVARSAELSSSAVLLAGVLVAANQGRAALGDLRTALRSRLDALVIEDLTPAQAGRVLADAGSAAFHVVAPVVLVAAVVGIAATVAQTGFSVVPKRILPDTQRMSPAKGMERIFSRRGLVELLKAVVKVALVSWVVWKVVLASGGDLPSLGLGTPREILERGGADIRRLLLWVASVLGAIAVADYLWQRHDHRQSLRMTRQQVKEEARQSEGDPKIRQRMRRAYREMTGNRMIADVAKAHVVVTNPTHIAVALRYQPDENGAPVVVAKGADERAERIKQAARRHGIPIVERRALARMLFRSVQVGREIPASLYRAVAEILAYIYSLQARRAG